MAQERAAWIGVCVALIAGVAFFAWAWRDELKLRRQADAALVKTCKERDHAYRDAEDAGRAIFHLQSDLADARTQLATRPDQP